MRRFWRWLRPCRHTDRKYVAHWITDVGMLRADLCRDCGICVIHVP